MELHDPSLWRKGYVRPKEAAKSSRPSKVISIPVRFIGSEEAEKQPSATASSSKAEGPAIAQISESAAAARIQKTARGFLVRKNMRAVRHLEAELEAIEESANGSVDRLQRDAKERIRVSEALMSLLFRLDSIRGVRDYRRRVIRRAIALQEAIDNASVDNNCNSSEDVARLSSCSGSEDEEETPEAVPEILDSGEISQDGGLQETPMEKCVREGELVKDPAESRDMAERMAEENRALRKLVADLCEKSEMQCRLMSGLVERIERLEKTVGKRERRRKRQACDVQRTRARKLERPWL